MLLFRAFCVSEVCGPLYHTQPAACMGSGSTPTGFHFGGKRSKTMCNQGLVVAR